MPDSTDTADDCPYVLGESYARRDTPRFEFKPGATGYTGGGYARVRSREKRDDTPGSGTDDVFVSIHRLMAVVHCYSEDLPLAEIQRRMIGTDVHHTLGMPSANIPDELDAREHGEHTEITNAQRRAWAEDAKRSRDDPTRDAETCTAQGCDREVKARVAGERYCLECATANANGEKIEIV